MSLPKVVYRPEARDDIDVAYITYELQQTGLGDRFADAVRDQVDKIQANPLIYGIVYQDVRATPLRRFPYVVYYRAEPDQVLIIAVQRGSRSWTNWQDRV